MVQKRAVGFGGGGEVFHHRLALRIGSSKVAAEGTKFGLATLILDV